MKNKRDDAPPIELVLFGPSTATELTLDVWEHRWLGDKFEILAGRGLAHSDARYLINLYGDQKLEAGTFELKAEQVCIDFGLYNKTVLAIDKGFVNIEHIDYDRQYLRGSFEFVTRSEGRDIIVSCWDFLVGRPPRSPSYRWSGDSCAP